MTVSSTPLFPHRPSQYYHPKSRILNKEATPPNKKRQLHPQLPKNAARVGDTISQIPKQKKSRAFGSAFLFYL
ncbi:MAG: hypothetical protein IJE62_00465 [Clostridia bacterium]|nr:hypothetical protein [Clostridia bacterium]